MIVSAPANTVLQNPCCPAENSQRCSVQEVHRADCKSEIQLGANSKCSAVSWVLHMERFVGWQKGFWITGCFPGVQVTLKYQFRNNQSWVLWWYIRNNCFLNHIACEN